MATERKPTTRESGEMAKAAPIGKLEAAERQLTLAVRLFFDRDDLIGIHTLTGAASQVLRDLAKKSGSSSPFRDRDIIRKGKKKEYNRHLDRAKNFFKHADKDPDAVLEFFPQSTKWLIFEAAVVHGRLTKRYIPETLVFMNWMNLKHPEILVEGTVKSAVLAGLDAGVDPDDFEVMQEVLSLTRTQMLGGSISQEILDG